MIAFDPAKLTLSMPGIDTPDSDSKRLAEAVKSATGVILATPEYHGTFSSVMKLFIENIGFPAALNTKPVALLGVAAGQIGAVKSLEHLRDDCSQQNGVTVKTLLGEESLIILDAQVKMDDVLVQPGSRFQRKLSAGNSLAAVTVTGAGKWLNAENDSEIAISKKDFTLFNAAADAVISVENSGSGDLRLAMIEVPQRVDYPLYG